MVLTSLFFNRVFILASIFQPLYSDVCISFLCSWNEARKPQVYKCIGCGPSLQRHDFFCIQRRRNFFRPPSSHCAHRSIAETHLKCESVFVVCELLLGDFHITYLINLNAIRMSTHRIACATVRNQFCIVRNAKLCTAIQRTF